MTTISFTRGKGGIHALTAEGHSGCGEYGSDIVCAAVTSAVRLIECTLNDVLGASVETDVETDAARITLRVPRSLPKEKSAVCQTVLEGAFAYFTQLQSEYPAYMKVMEV